MKKLIRYLSNSTVPTLCGHRIDLKNAEYIMFHEIARKTRNWTLEDLLTDYNTITQNLNITEASSQVQKESIMRHLMSSDYNITYKEKAMDEIARTIQDLSRRHKSRSIYCVIGIHPMIPTSPDKHDPSYILKIGSKNECKNFAEELEDRKEQIIKREGLLPNIIIFSCIFAFIAAIAAIITIILM